MAVVVVLNLAFTTYPRVNGGYKVHWMARTTKVKCYTSKFYNIQRGRDLLEIKAVVPDTASVCATENLIAILQAGSGIVFRRERLPVHCYPDTTEITDSNELKTILGSQPWTVVAKKNQMEVFSRNVDKQNKDE